MTAPAITGVPRQKRQLAMVIHSISCTLSEDCLISAEVDARQREVVAALVIAGEVVVGHEGFDLPLELAG
jgi:hypothetical protein